MSRDKFISDNLYNMRDSFKRNHAGHQSSSEINSIPREMTEQTPTVSEPQVSSKTRLPQLAGFRNDSEAGRDRRDLEGRLLRDLNFIDAEEEFSRQHTAALSRFRSVVEKELEQLRELDASSSDAAIFRTTIDRLRIEYFQASGRFEAEISRRSTIGTVSNDSSTNVRPAATWPVAAAIIASAVIVSLTMLVLFGG